MKKVMCFGTFDLLHLGHLNYFQQAKKHGDYLIVIIARDKTKQMQKKEIIFSEKERLELVKNLQIVDEAVLGYPDNHFRVIEEKRPDVIFLGYDHKVDEKVLAKKLQELGLKPKILRAKPFKVGKHKSTLLREKVIKGY
ncbi:MAG: adenylyltransferase/cytidyltransferase family protein [Nanoarchaeota archaeon]|nr:adenylyltransferase/cytidyltransferase family protein [Nanoarchaeota archaeon]